MRDAATAAGQPKPRIDSYFRTALGSAALPRLRDEANRYASFPKYAAHFARMGVTALDTCITGETAEELDARLNAFADVLDEAVIRAITANEDAAEYLALLEAVAPR